MTRERAGEAGEDLAVAVAEHHALAVPERVVVVDAVVDGRVEGSAGAVEAVAAEGVPEEVEGRAQPVERLVDGDVAGRAGRPRRAPRTPGSASRPCASEISRSGAGVVSATRVSPSSIDSRSRERTGRYSRGASSVARAASAARSHAGLLDGGDPREQVRGNDRVGHAPRLAGRGDMAGAGHTLRAATGSRRLRGRSPGSRRAAAACRRPAARSSTFSVGPSSTMRPSFMTTTSSHRFCTTPMSCETSSSVRPSRARSCAEQLEDLRAHGHIERRQRLVADEQSRPMRDRAREGDPLSLAARELVREPVRHRGLEADVLEHLVHTRAPVALDPERPQRLGDDPPDAHARIERRVRVLEHDAGLAAQPVQRAGAGARIDRAPVELDGARGRRVEGEEQADERRLARARLADDADRGARADVDVGVLERRREGCARSNALRRGMPGSGG